MGARRRRDRASMLRARPRDAGVDRGLRAPGHRAAAARRAEWRCARAATRHPARPMRNECREAASAAAPTAALAAATYPPTMSEPHGGRTRAPAAQTSAPPRRTQTILETTAEPCAALQTVRVCRLSTADSRVQRRGINCVVPATGGAAEGSRRSHRGLDVRHWWRLDVRDKRRL